MSCNDVVFGPGGAGTRILISESRLRFTICLALAVGGDRVSDVEAVAVKEFCGVEVARVLVGVVCDNSSVLGRFACLTIVFTCDESLQMTFVSRGSGVSAAWR